MEFSHDDSMAEFGQLFNFEQATTPSQAQKGKTVVSPPFTAPGPENAYIPPQQPTFTGPSHQYELFRQHTSLAPGAYPSMQRARQMSSRGYGPGPNAPFLDVNEVEGGSFSGMDMDLGDMFDGSSMNGFVDPSSVGTGSDAGDASPVAQPVQRLWPGMHQQHAAAKEQQKKLEQQKLQEQQRMAIVQHQLGSSAAPGHQRRPSQNRSKLADPLVEERISQILRSMRQNNARNSSSTTPQPALSQPAKQRKDEEDMDDDERLLASEEGKKLSSKERRQLRNKVSARAFRSRRKEYISQLEGELQDKTNAADDLRSENEALRAENAQLTDLARMLLSQPAFNNVLEDFAARGSPMPIMAPQSAQQHPTPMNQGVPPATTAASSQAPVTTPMDFSTPMDGWNSGIAGPDFNFNPNVFAVMELPEPIIETSILSGKASEFSSPSLPALENGKPDHPVLERHQPKSDHAVIESPPDHADSDIFGLPTVLRSGAAQRGNANATSLRLADKPTVPRFELISPEQARDEQKVLASRFESLCERLDAVCDRIASLTPHT